jgi:hypothetical protein
MTAQVNDAFIFRRRKFDISAIEFPENFIDIYSLGFKPIEFDTGCWRGYISTFSISNKKLVLKNLYTNNGNKTENEAPLINGKLPEINIPKDLVEEYKNTWQEFTYKNINLIVPYTGSILITKDFIWEEYVHMGFQSPFNYEIVIQLLFNDGKYIISKDLSETAKQIREKKLNIPEKYNDDENYIGHMLKWINDSFDISYSNKVKGLLESG